MCKGKEVYDYTLSLNIGVDISLNMFYMPVCDIWHHTVYFCAYFSSALYCVTAEFVTSDGRLLFLCDEAVTVPLWGQRAGKSTCLRLHHSPDNIGSWAAAQQIVLTLSSPVVSNGYTSTVQGHTGLTHHF